MSRKPIVFTAVITISVGILGCASVKWQNPNIAPEDVGRQLQIDSAECMATALQSYPVKDIPTPAPVAPPSYSTSGTVNLTDQYGNMYMGFYNGTSASAHGYDPSAAIRSGAATAQALAYSIDAPRFRRQIAEACMSRRGWEKVLVQDN